MNLIITWNNPTPLPSCGYTAYYRRKGDPAYTLINTSGSTSAVTSVNTYLTVPADIEGYVVSNCCENNLSMFSPFGINIWSPVNTVISLQSSPSLAFLATITSTYPNPYPTYINGNFNYTTSSGTTNIQYTALYPANSKSAVITLSGTPSISNIQTISGNVVTSIVPSFDNGGSLQQFDEFLTPPYFAFYDGATSGVTWLGSPATLPSFTIDAFNITAEDTGGSTMQGNLLVSWIQSSIYGTSGNTIPLPFNQVIFQVKDAGNNIIGTLTTFPGQLGVVNAVIPLTRSSASYPLIRTTQFVMICRWADNSLISSNTFYFP